MDSPQYIYIYPFKSEPLQNLNVVQITENQQNSPVVLFSGLVDNEEVGQLMGGN